MRLALIADLHGRTPPVPACDVLVIAGDLAPRSTVRDAVRQRAWFDTTFRTWVEEADAAHVIGIAGNHDQMFEDRRELVPTGVRWSYLEDSACTVAGLKFWGSPWTPWFHGMAFNAPEIDGEEHLKSTFSAVPPDTDVLVLHGPPAGFGDVTAAGASVGSEAARDLLMRVRPRLCVFGHVHEGRGRWWCRDTLVINAAAVDGQWRTRRDPFVVVEL
jgi:Icc-related predicted phosphoesterase